MKTPIHELISEFDKMLEGSTNYTSRHVIGRCIRKAYDMVEKEKEVIMTAFVDGDNRGTNDIPFNCEQYYSQKFESIDK